MAAISASARMRFVNYLEGVSHASELSPLGVSAIKNPGAAELSSAGLSRIVELKAAPVQA